MLVLLTKLLLLLPLVHLLLLLLLLIVLILLPLLLLLIRLLILLILLDIGGKVLEKLLIDRINLHVFSNSLLNGKQYGFLPEKRTIDAALAVKGFIREN